MDKDETRAYTPNKLDKLDSIMQNWSPMNNNEEFYSNFFLLEK